MTETLAPETLLHDRYRIVRSIGRGGMGAVYEAVDTRLGNTVALKQTLASNNADSQSQVGVLHSAFEREARLLASLRHAALPVVSDYFTEGDGRFLVMQYIPGEDLGALLEERNGPFELSDVLRWGDQLLDALDYLHTQEPPVIHRDIKPQNLKTTSRGEIVLLDFGLAKANAGPNKTGSLSVLGYTPQYAPLEQIRGSGTGPRSDLYSLAATLYHLLTGVAPANALERAAANLNREQDPLRPAHEINPRVPQNISHVLELALALQAEHRPTSAAAMRAALMAAARSGNTGATIAVPRTAEPRPEPVRTTTSPGFIGTILGLAAALIGLLVICGGVGYAFFAVRPSEIGPTPIVATRTIEEDPVITAILAPTLVPPDDVPVAIPTVIAEPTVQPGFLQQTLTFGGEGTGTGRFQDPRTLGVAGDGSIYVGDYNSGRVQRFDASGKYMSSWLVEGSVPIMSLAVDQQGLVYLLRGQSVEKYRGETGELIGTLGVDWQQDTIHNMVLLPDGRLMLLTTCGGQRSGTAGAIQIIGGQTCFVFLDQEGNEVNRITDPLPENSSSIATMAVDGLGTIFMVGSAEGEIYIVDRDGEFTDRISVATHLAFPSIVIDNRGRIFLSSFDGLRVFDQKGNQLAEMKSFAGTDSMVFDQQNNLYAINNDDMIVKYSVNLPEKE